MGKRTFPTLAIASAATGVGLADGFTFSTMSEISAFVLGHPVWTHELGDKVMTARIYRAIATQLPRLPTRELAHADWRAAASEALSAYGDTVELTEGTGERTESPIDSLARMTGRPDKIVAIVVEEPSHD